MTRWKASAIHLSICAVIGLTVAAVMLLLWYPPPYFEALAGGRLLLILLGVDVVIGPLITLIIYNPAKKTLKFDLAVIALLQLSALMYGVHVVYEARPVFVVFSVDRFDVVAANEIDPQEQKKVTLAEFKSLPLDGPRLVAVNKPSDLKEQQRILFAALGGYDLPRFPQHYVPYQEHTAAVLARAKPLDELRKARPEAASSFAQLETQLGARMDDLAFLPLVTRKQDLTAIIDRASGDLVKVVPVDPWL